MTALNYWSSGGGCAERLILISGLGVHSHPPQWMNQMAPGRKSVWVPKTKRNSYLIGWKLYCILVFLYECRENITEIKYTYPTVIRLHSVVFRQLLGCFCPINPFVMYLKLETLFTQANSKFQVLLKQNRFYILHSVLCIWWLKMVINHISPHWAP